MPRVKDIAWKFVIKLDGDKWRCPHCENEYFGKVTRVRSHLLKQSNKGIAPCKKVPEHISKLLGWLQNQVPNKDDIAWKFVYRPEDKKWRCYHCSEEFFGDLTRVKGHLLEGSSICTEVPDHIRELMRSLLDEVAEEESREANGQSSKEPQSCDLPTQTEVAEEESKEAKERRVQRPTGLVKHMEQLSFNRQNIIRLNSDQQSQAERWFHQSSTMPLSVQNSHGENVSRSSMTFAEVESYLLDSPYWPQSSIPAPYPEEMQMNDQHTPAGASSFQFDRTTVPHSEEPLPSCNDERGTETGSFPLQESVDIYPLTATHVDLQVLEGEANVAGPSSSSQVQPALVPLQHQSVPHQSVNHSTRNVQQNPTMHLDNLDTTQQPDLLNHRLDVAHGNEIASSLQQLLMDSQALSSLYPSELPHLDHPTHLEMGNEPQNSRGLSQYDQAPGEPFPDGITIDSSDCSNFFNSLPEIHEEIQTNELQTPTVGSSLQNDSSLDVDGTNRLPDGQPSLVEVLPVLSPTNTVQHPDQLHPRCDKEYGNDARSFASQTPMDIDPSPASQHTTDSHIIKATIVDSQVPEASTNTTGPSSSQDMNRVSPIMNVRSSYSNDEMIRNLKRKMEELDYKEAVTKEQVEIESGASSVRKKPRIVVQKWLNETEKARNNFQMIGQANAEILPPTEQVETLMREVEELIEQTLPHPLLIEARDAKGNAFLERKLIGEKIHTDIELIWNRLKENNGCKLGICGMGGVGKTTIMMHVHNRLLKDATFDGVLFITVSQDFSIYKLQSDVWKALNFGDMEDEHEMKRAAKLSECLKRKKNCVLILDDVWQNFKLQDVGIPDNPGLKVVLTTRFSGVCSQMDCEEIKIQPLGEEEAWKLFEEELGPKLLTNKQVEEVARKIANRCAGLPLAINAMASSMRGEHKVYVWQATLDKLEIFDTEHTELGHKVLPVLRHSYHRLSDPQVKQCFEFCALFPEDSLIEKNELIEYFIDEGFLDGLDSREKQYCRGLDIVHKLRNACLLEVDYGRVRMHDLIRDMTLQIMSTAYKVLRRLPNGEEWTADLEKVSLMWGRIEDIPPDMSPNCPKLSTLLLNGSLQLENVQLQDSFFVNLRGLKVLNLSKCAITKLPDSLSDLANLRALLLRNCGSLIRIPYLGKLKYLRKLDAIGCKSLLAVEGLEELSNLRYLDLCETGIERSWEVTFSRMVNLQYLKIAGKVKAEEVIRLKALKRLECNFGNVDDFNEYVRFMERRGEHHNYKLIVDQEKSLWFVSESVYSDLEILPENKMEYGWDEDEGYDYRKRSVKIRSCNYAMARVGEERNKDCIWIPGDVEFFKGENCRGVTNLSGMSGLRDLKLLKIVKWDNLVELFGGAGVDAEEIDNTQDSPAPLFPSLKKLIISRCSKLKYLFGHESRFSLPHLCEGIEGMNSSVASPPQPEESGNMKRVEGSKWLPHFPSLKQIRVAHCENIRELLPHECLLHLPNLEKMRISYCEKLEEIIGGGPVPIGATCGRLRYLKVKGCNNMKGVLLTLDMLLHLPSLQTVVVKDCESIEEIIAGGPVPIGATCGLTFLFVNRCNSMKRVLKTQDMVLDFPSLQRIVVQNCKGIEVIIGAVANMTHTSFPKLTSVTLWNLPELKSVCGDGGSVSCNSLQYLEICRCPKLKSIRVQLHLIGRDPSPPPSLCEIWIDNRQTWDHVRASSSLQRLVSHWEFDLPSDGESDPESDGENDPKSDSESKEG